MHMKQHEETSRNLNAWYYQKVILTRKNNFPYNFRSRTNMKVFLLKFLHTSTAQQNLKTYKTFVVTQ
jgi:hypothetical protein